MRVLFWSQYFWPYIGGSEVFAINLLPALQERGHEFIVVASHSNFSSPDKTEYNGIPIYRFPFREALANRDIQQIIEICRQISEIKRNFRPDLVHINSVGPIDFFHHHTAHVYPIPYLITMQQYIPRESAKADSLLHKTLSGVAALGLCSMVEFLGWVSPEKVPELIDKSTIVIMPSRIEPFGLVALQAAQMARPVVGTRVGGLPEIVIDRGTGFLVESEDSESLADAIAFLLDHTEIAGQMGRAARQRALGVLNWERCVDGYDELYRSLISSHKRRIEYERKCNQG